MLIFGLRCSEKLTHGDPGACSPQLKDRARPPVRLKFMVNPFVMPGKPSGQACGCNGLGITTQTEGGTRWGRNPAGLTPACQRGVRKDTGSGWSLKGSIVGPRHPRQPSSIHLQMMDRDPRGCSGMRFIHKTEESAGENFSFQCEQSWMKPSLLPPSLSIPHSSLALSLSLSCKLE